VKPKKQFLIELALGPYEVNVYTARKVAREIVYRHYKPIELKIARQFIRECILPGTYYFDVYLLTPEAEQFMARYPPHYWRMAIPYLMKIDAVCYQPEAAWILEFKEELRPSAIGQLITYKDLFTEQYNPEQPVSLMAVVIQDKPALHYTLQRNLIQLKVLTKIED